MAVCSSVTFVVAMTAGSGNAEVLEYYIRYVPCRLVAEGVFARLAMNCSQASDRASRLRLRGCVQIFGVVNYATCATATCNYGSTTEH